MIDHVGRELAGGGFRLHAGDELAARSAHHLHLDFGEALVEGLDPLLLALREVRGVVDEPAFLLGGGDELGRTEILRGRRHCKHARKAERGQDRFHGDVPPVVVMLIYPARPTLASALPRDSHVATPISTASSTVCTRLKAAVFPVLPPS